MARQRLGVVLLVPQPAASQVDGLRLALGDGARGRIEPHVTLVSPVNVADRDLSAVLAAVRGAAASCAPLTLQLGPVATFAPVTPVAYLRVGDEAVVDALSDLRDRLHTGPLDRPGEHAFVPHVTVADDLTPGRLEAAERALGDFATQVAIDRLHVLSQRADRVWVPIGDAPLGGGGGTVGRGSLPLEVSVSGRPDLEAAALLAIAQPAPGRPFAVTGRRDGVAIAAAWGWTTADRLELADLVVAAAHRGEGVGRHLLAAVEGLGARRGCGWAGAAAPVAGAAGALLRAAGWEVGPAPGGPTDTGGPGGSVRWQRRLSPASAAGTDG